VDLFMRESGAVGAPAIVFLHGGEYSGRSWQPVVDRLQEYHCLVPDLPQHGRSFRHHPFEMAGAAAAVKELIYSRAGAGRVHVVGFSLGAQVGVQLLAAAPELIDRAVLCGTIVDVMPGAPQAQQLLELLARMSRSLWFSVGKNARHVGLVPAKLTDHRADMRLMPPAQIGRIVSASVGFGIPDGLEEADAHALFLTGAKEMRMMHRSAAVLAQQMPNGVDRVAVGMRHDWPLRYPDLFSRTVTGWLSDTTLPVEITAPDSSRR
jgi:pimeloyl-ACP methyl ester carboxylesterase